MEKKSNKIGLSLSFCVNDILKGIIKEEEVTKIIASTDASTPKDWEVVIGEYKKRYWKDNPEEGEAITRRLLKADKIKQPRVKGENVVYSISNGWWLEDGPDLEEMLKKKIF